MDLFIYNTLTRKKELFETIEPGKVLMYVCGPTVYDSCHIGHARAFVVFDVIVRFLESAGKAVTYVRNFTDVDDKIINRANELGVSPLELADRFIKEFQMDMQKLHVRRPTVEPRVTDHMQEIVDFVVRLLKKGAAYVADGDVYFAVDSFEAYGKLSGRSLEDMEAGARVDVDERKHNPFDFALWKSAKPGEPAWESPWGRGRPGWHIECSAMSSKYLGHSFDIHGGGKDLVFPHHENEIAQSESVTGNIFARYWIHNGFVNINQEKMSKSLGNFLMVKDVLKAFHPEAVRLFLLSKQYRKPIDFSDGALEESTTALERIYASLQRMEKRIGESGGANEDAALADELWQQFCGAMQDDFNTAKAFAVIFEAVRQANRLMDDDDGGKGELGAASLKGIRHAIEKMGWVMGILNQRPDDYFAARKTEQLEDQSIDAGLVEELIRERAAARREKNWPKADEIRDRLAAMNVVVEDRPDGAVWKVEK
ncbi:MAG: cysteine--tRNA ligase [Deltaproteobacteria bacterium]|nr:cysteine--tRNA ligase [Deltaproteobacteria bacterium]